MGDSTLGNSARVSIAPATIQSYAGVMTQKKKRELRREQIIAYIKRKPYGTRIKMEEFQQVAGFKTNANADAFIKNMVRDKVLIKENITPRTYFYVVPGDDVRVTKAADPRRKKLTPLEIEQMAMQWSWANPDCYNDLRKFIQSITAKEQQNESTEEHSTEEPRPEQH